MLKSTLLCFFLMMCARRARPGLTWKDVTVMSVEEISIVQIHVDVVNTARALLNETVIGDGRVHAKAHPDLLEHTGWI